MLDYKELIKNFKEEDFKLKRVNLHVHTDYSDGEGDFDELVRPVSYTHLEHTYFQILALSALFLKGFRLNV